MTLKKELIWNLALLFSGALFALAYALDFNFSNEVKPGWTDPYWVFTPFGMRPSWVVALATGIGLISLRYVLLGIFAIKNTDLRLGLLLITILLPWLLSVIRQGSTLDRLQALQEPALSTENFHEQVKKLRQCGFFKQNLEQSDELITEQLLGKLFRISNGRIDVRFFSNDDFSTELMKYDTAKTLSHCDDEWVIEGNRGYEQLIINLGRISEGYFNPDHVKEQWMDHHNIELGFENNGQLHKIRLNVKGDWADTKTVIVYVNKVMEQKNYQFYQILEDDTLIVGLSDKEKESLSNNLNIHWIKPD